MALFMHFTGGTKIYPLVPTLERIAAIKIAITVWNRNDIRSMMKEHLTQETAFDYQFSQWENIEEKVKSYVEQLLLPQLVKKEILRFIKPIGLEILEWKKLHKIRFGKIEDYDASIPNQMCWTAYGTIDVKKTVVALVGNENLSVDLRYKVACTYCFEKTITELKDKVSDEVKDLAVRAGEYWKGMHMWNCIMELNDILEKEVRSQRFRRFRKRADVKQHIRDIKRDMRGTYHHLLNTSVHNLNKEAVEYLMTKLSFKPKSNFLQSSIYYLQNTLGGISHWKFQSELYFFLFSQIREEQQRQMFFSLYGHGVLKCCLNWPRQDLFLPIANHLQTFIAEGHYEYVLISIVSKTKDGFKDYDYSQLFTKVWKQSLHKHKMFAIRRCESDTNNLFRHLFEIGDVENIRLMWKDASPKSQKKIIAFCKNHSCIVPDPRSPLSFFDEVMGIKKSWESLFLFVSELSCTHGSKRKMADQTDCNPCKKFFGTN